MIFEKGEAFFFVDFRAKGDGGGGTEKEILGERVGEG